jgi:putative beta-barrel porin BBP2
MVLSTESIAMNRYRPISRHHLTDQTESCGFWISRPNIRFEQQTNRHRLISLLWWFGFACAVQILSGLASAQDLSLSRPGSLNFASPSGDNGEGIFTALPFKRSSYAMVGYDDNIFTSHTDKVGSMYNEFGFNAQINVGNERTQLTGTGTAGFIVYWHRPGTKVDPNVSFDLSFSHQFSERTVVTLDSILTYQAQPDVSAGVGVLNEVANYLYSQNKLSIGFQWTRRIATFTNYSLNVINYDSDALGRDNDRIEQLISEEIRYLLEPTIVALVQYQFGYEDYEHQSQSNSQTHTFLLGADFTPSPRLNFSFRAGAELRYQNFGSQSPELLPYGETTVDYKLRPASTIEWYNHYGLEESDINSQGYRKTYRTGLKLTDQIGTKTTVSAAIYYSNSEYAGPVVVTENTVDAELNGNYAITRKLSLTGGYSFVRVSSTLSTRAYSHSRINAGLSYSF